MRILRRPRAWTAVCIAAVLSVGGVSLPLLGAKATPAANQEDGAETPARAVPQLELFVAPERAQLTADDTEVRFSVLLRNSGNATAPEGSVELTLGQRLSGDSAEMPAPGDGSEAPAPGDGPGAQPEAPPAIIATVSIDAVAEGQEQTATVAVPLADLALLTPETHGVYPVHASYVASDAPEAEPVTAFSPLVWGSPGKNDAAVNLTTIVPLTLPSSVQSMPSRAQLSDATPRLSALLDYATASQSILAIDPRIITAIRGYGTEAPREATELLTKLESTALPSFLLQFGDADPAAQAALGLGELMEPAGFEFITRFGAWDAPVPETPDSAAGTAPAEGQSQTTGHSDAEQTGATSPTGAVDEKAEGATEAPDKEAPSAPQTEPAVPEGSADPTEPTDPTEPAEQLPPTAEELREWPRGLPAAWPASGQADSRTLALLRGADLDLTVLSSDNVSLSGGPRAKLGTGAALVTDAELDAAVRLALVGGTDTERALGEARAAARLALAAGSGVEGLILGIDREGVAESDRPEELLAQLTTARWIKHVGHGAQREGSANLVSASPDEERLELLQAALDNESTVLEARAMLVQPEFLDSYQRMRVLALFGTQHAAPDVSFTGVARQFAKRDAELHDGVRLVDTKRAQLVGGSTRIPIQLRNSLPFDAIVNLDVSPTSAALLLPEREFKNILLPEDSSERVLVPTKSRVSSGESALLLSVTSVDGDYTASTGRLEIAISSAVETVAIAILGSAAALLFGFGIWRSVRRRKSLSPRE